MEFPFLDSAVQYWVELRPDATAVRFGGASYSYAELDETASAIAGDLSARGVGVGDRIGLCAAKSFESIAAILGILKAGAAYVPIDPAAPQKRIVSILDDCALRYVLTDKKSARRIPTEQTAISISTAISGGLTGPELDRTEDDLAYILYTSGSTGAPKGICHTHKSGNAYARMAAKRCDLKRTDRVSHLTPFHFDMSIFDIFSTLSVGGTIVVIPEIYAKMPANLSQLVQDEVVTVWYSVPHAMAQLAHRGVLEDRDLSSLRVVMFAGEVMPPPVLQAFAKHLPQAAYLNAYGPTETNHCTTASIPIGAIDGKTACPIGFPDQGVTSVVSETGELLIASDQVMQGYWNDAERTDEVIVMREHNGVPMRFYRTGDLVTQTETGELMLIGRADRQIKLRGFRVELDEVELVLNQCDGVHEVAVVVAEDGENLLAFASGEFDVADLAAHAKSSLPSYCVPSRICRVEDLLRTSTGKIDRKALTKEFYDRTAA